MKTRHAGVLVSGLLVLPASLGLATPSASAASPALASPVDIFTGNAFGTFAEVGNRAIAGRSAVVTLCTTKAGVTKSNDVSSVDVPSVVHTGAVRTSLRSSLRASGPLSRASAAVFDANLLTGVISATAVHAVSKTSHDGTGFKLQGSGSFTDLVINGRAIGTRPAPNTTVRLPGVGRVVLNEQIRDVGANSASLTVNMMHVYVTKNLAGVAKGTRIIVAHATSGLSVNRAGTLDGMAYGTTLFDDNGVSSGPSARVVLGCNGTDGKLKTNNVAGVDVPLVLTTGAVTTTAQGTITADSAAAETTAKTANVMLLVGLVTADEIKADAHATKTAGGIALRGGGSNYTKLVVNGNPISGHVAPNTRIDVGNVTVWLHRVIRHSNSIEIRMVEVVVHGTNPFGLATGTHIQVSVAEASAH